jgi:DNA-binding transcriptional ArsR family regulator
VPGLRSQDFAVEVFLMLKSFLGIKYRPPTTQHDEKIESWKSEILSELTDNEADFGEATENIYSRALDYGLSPEHEAYHLGKVAKDIVEEEELESRKVYREIYRGIRRVKWDRHFRSRRLDHIFEKGFLDRGK